MATLKKVMSALCVVVGFGLFAAEPYGSVSVTAKPENGWVFAGWYTDSQFENTYVASDGVDYRTATRKYSVPDALALFPRFVTTESDMASIEFEFAPAAFYNSNNPLVIPLSSAVKSWSLPTLTVANLPTGLRYDAKTLSITGTPTKPGEAREVKFVIKNLSNKSGRTFTCDFKIGDAQSDLLPGLKYNDADAYRFIPGVPVSDMAEKLGDAVMNELAKGGWTVSGLPAGMSFNPRFNERI